MKVARSTEPITSEDLQELYDGSMKRLQEYFLKGRGQKWKRLYNIKKPLAVALCQGAAMHYVDGTNGVKDFDVWFFYPFNRRHLPFRSIWRWDYQNPKFGRHPRIPGCKGRRVDVLVRSIKCKTRRNPAKTLCQYLEAGKTASSRALAKKAVVMLYPEKLRGRVIWYKEEI